jgi:hypothetical protein
MARPLTGDKTKIIFCYIAVFPLRRPGRILYSFSMRGRTLVIEDEKELAGIVATVPPEKGCRSGGGAVRLSPG